jgi:hypothetical protein
MQSVYIYTILYWIERQNKMTAGEKGKNKLRIRVNMRYLHFKYMI